MNTNSILQQKLSPGEIEYLGLIIDCDKPLRRIEGPLRELDGELKFWWPQSGALAVPARRLRQRIINLAVKADTNNRGHVRLAMMTGHMRRLIPEDSKTPTRYAVLDFKNGVFCQGWLDAGAPNGNLDASIGMKVVCQPTKGKTYEDWVGMGASLDVNPTTTARQRERILLQELVAVRPLISVTQRRWAELRH